MVECYLDTVEVSGSNPLVPTRKFKGFQIRLKALFFVLPDGMLLAVSRSGDNRLILSMTDYHDEVNL